MNCPQISGQVLLAARQRGISLLTLSAVCGVSWQALQFRIRRYEKNAGLDAVRYRAKNRLKVARHPKKCATCGIVTWVISSRARGKFCSPVCYGVWISQVPEKEIDRAMELRMRGYTWTRIAKIMGITIQAMQNRIWAILYRRRQLTEPRLRELWYQTINGRQPSWNWLINETGVMPSVDGGISL